MGENLEDLKTEFEEALRELDGEMVAKDATIESLSRKLEDARGRIEELERDFAKLQSPEGVHINMLSGKIAKISMMLCAHTHGEEAVREFRAKDARIAELERELGRDDEDLPYVKPMSKEAYEECMRLASDYEDRRAFEVPAVAARIAEQDQTIATLREACKFKNDKIEELDAQATLRGREMWAIWNSCNGVFEVTNWRKDALDVIAEAYSEHETVVPVRVFVEPEDDHDLRHSHEDDREVLWRERAEKEQAE